MWNLGDMRLSDVISLQENVWDGSSPSRVFDMAGDIRRLLLKPPRKGNHQPQRSLQSHLLSVLFCVQLTAFSGYWNVIWNKMPRLFNTIKHSTTYNLQVNSASWSLYGNEVWSFVSDLFVVHRWLIGR